MYGLYIGYMEAIDLKTLRISRGRLQEDLGSQPVVSDYEHGRRFPGAAAIKAMANALDVAPELVYAACEESQRRGDAERAKASAATPSVEQPAKSEG